jgi:23S rRNA pseudouridine1911/1915/1917 synthase
MMERIEHTFVIPREYHNQRIDSVLAALIPDYSRSQLSQWIKNGCIQINQNPCKPKDKVQAESIVHLAVDLITTPDSFELCAPEPIPLTIIYEDEDVLVLNKPPGLVVHPGAGNKEHTLINALVHHEPKLQHVPRAGIIHRLDKDTTGLLIVAKTLAAHTALIRQMQERTIQRHYLTLVEGHVISGGVIDTGYGRHPRNRLKMAVSGQGRQAITHYFINKQYGDYTVLDVQLMTGRTHQIRVHMAHINHPVIGDPLYGRRARIPTEMDEALKTRLQGFKRQALHARFISFYHPKTGEELKLTASLPEDFDNLLSAMDTYYEHSTS